MANSAPPGYESVVGQCHPGGYGVSTGKAAKVEGVHQEIDVASTADILAHARSVIIVPG